VRIVERGVDALKRELVKIKPSTVRRSEAVVSWKAIAYDVGVGRSTLIRWCEANGIRLPHYGPANKSPVFLPRGKIMILKDLYFA